MAFIMLTRLYRRFITSEICYNLSTEPAMQVKTIDTARANVLDYKNNFWVIIGTITLLLCGIIVLSMLRNEFQIAATYLHGLGSSLFVKVLIELTVDLIYLIIYTLGLLRILIVTMILQLYWDLISLGVKHDLSNKTTYHINNNLFNWKRFTNMITLYVVKALILLPLLLLTLSILILPGWLLSHLIPSIWTPYMVTLSFTLVSILIYFNIRFLFAAKMVACGDASRAQLLKHPSS